MNREQELQALRRPFAVGAACVVLAVVAIGVVVGLLGSNADRPAGIAERWLVAIGDTTRDGVEEDARARVEELSAAHDSFLAGDVLTGLSDTAADEGEAAFEAVRVGPPLEGAGDFTVVPAAVTPRDGEVVQVHVALDEIDGRWRVLGLQPTGPEGAFGCPVDADCPGFPIERPERAPLGWFVGALLLGGLITLGCVAAVRAATPKPA